MAGDILSLTSRANGDLVTVEADYGSTGGTYDVGNSDGNALDPASDWETDAKFQGTVDRPGYTTAGASTTYTDDPIFGTKIARQAYPNNASLDESINGSSKLEFKIWLDMPLFGSDANAAANLTAAIVSVSGTPSNAASGLSITGATRAYPRPILRCATVPFQRVTGEFDVEFVVDHYFAMNGAPVACVKVTASDTDDGGAVSQTVTATYVRKQWSGSGLYCGVYRATLDAADFGQGKRIKVTAEALPWRGDVTTNSATLEDGLIEDPLVIGPNEYLGPVYFLGDKNNALACYASVDSVSGNNGTGAVSATKAGARSAPYATVAAALAALKTYNNANNGDNSVNNCYLLMQDGTYVVPGTFTGSNTKSLCVVQADTENGATEAGVQFTSGLNQICAAYIAYRNVTIAGSSTGMVRGSTTAGVLWLDSCTINVTGTAAIYSWAAIYATNNTITEIAGDMKAFATTRGPWVLVCGNVGGAGAGLICFTYLAICNKRIRFTLQPVGTSYSAAGHAVGDNGIVGWNEHVGMASGEAFTEPPCFREGYARTGTAQAGAATTITLDASASASNNLYNGVMIEITGGTGSGQRRRITAYNGTTKVATVHKAWSTNPDATSTFSIMPDGLIELGYSYIGNAGEQWGAQVAPLMGLSADTTAGQADGAHVHQALFTLCTGAGSRFNIFYNDYHSMNKHLCRARFIVQDETLNIKTDLFNSDGANINNWEAVNGVGWMGNVVAQTIGFDPEFAGRYSKHGTGSLTFTHNGGFNGDNDGADGDYHVTGDPEDIIPAGLAPCGWDLYGTAYRDDGTDSGGAINRVAGPGSSGAAGVHSRGFKRLIAAGVIE